MLVPSDERVTRHASSQLWSLFTGSTTASKIPSQGAHEDGRAQASLEELARACAHVAHPISSMSTPTCCPHRLASAVPGPPLPESHRPKSHLKCNSGCRTCTLQFHFASPIPSRKASACIRGFPGYAALNPVSGRRRGAGSVAQCVLGHLQPGQAGGKKPGTQQAAMELEGPSRPGQGGAGLPDDGHSSVEQHPGDREGLDAKRLCGDGKKIVTMPSQAAQPAV